MFLKYKLCGLKSFVGKSVHVSLSVEYYSETKNVIVNIKEIAELTEARVVAGAEKEINIERAFSSDLMSDVLTLDDHRIVLITGLANVQLIRTVEMADIPVVLLSRNKIANPEMISLAEENGIVLLETPYSMFRVSGILYENGLKPLY
jgi:serine kinase of HPr protein (carbohydrate metabolism regulator)